MRSDLFAIAIKNATAAMKKFGEAVRKVVETPEFQQTMREVDAWMVDRRGGTQRF